MKCFSFVHGVSVGQTKMLAKKTDIHEILHQL